MTHLKPDFIQNYEIDRDVKNISNRFNKRYKDIDKYRCIVKDIMWEKFIEREEKRIIYDLIINTSCEHMFPMTRFYSLNKFKKYPLYVLQSTDDEQWDDHINCVSSPDELIEQAKITEVLYSGKRELDNGMKRFMVIGYPSKDVYRNDDVVD
jgi:enterochelin esterase-like enzyme